MPAASTAGSPQAANHTRAAACTCRRSAAEGRQTSMRAMPRLVQQQGTGARRRSRRGEFPHIVRITPARLVDNGATVTVAGPFRAALACARCQPRSLFPSAHCLIIGCWCGMPRPAADPQPYNVKLAPTGNGALDKALHDSVQPGLAAEEGAGRRLRADRARPAGPRTVHHRAAKLRLLQGAGRC